MPLHHGVHPEPDVVQIRGAEPEPLPADRDLADIPEHPFGPASPREPQRGPASVGELAVYASCSHISPLLFHEHVHIGRREGVEPSMPAALAVLINVSGPLTRPPACRARASPREPVRAAYRKQHSLALAVHVCAGAGFEPAARPPLRDALPACPSRGGKSMLLVPVALLHLL